MRNIDEAGYTMAKSAVVTLTRSFGQKSRNGPWRQHGIKAFALCPWFANTQLVQNAGFDAKAMEKKTNFRVLTVSEVTFYHGKISMHSWFLLLKNVETFSCKNSIVTLSFPIDSPPQSLSDLP